MIIFYILVTLIFDSVLILLGEITCVLLLREKGWTALTSMYLNFSRLGSVKNVSSRYKMRTDIREKLLQRLLNITGSDKVSKEQRRGRNMFGILKREIPWTVTQCRYKWRTFRSDLLHLHVIVWVWNHCILTVWVLTRVHHHFTVRLSICFSLLFVD